MTCQAVVIVGDPSTSATVRVHCVRTDPHDSQERHHGGLFGRPSVWRGTEEIRPRW